MKNNYRHFSEIVEDVGRVWRENAFELPEDAAALSDQPKWLEKDGFNCLVKEKGRFASDPRYTDDINGLAQEKIAADLGEMVGAPVAPGTLLQPYADQPDKFWYLSMNPFGGDEDSVGFLNNSHRLAKDLYQVSDNLEADKRLFHDLAKQNTALWVFYMWIGDVAEHQNRRDNYLISVQEGPEGDIPVMAGIDHGGAALERERMRATFSPLRSSVYKIPPMDLEAGRDMVQRIQALSLDDIENIVFRVPDVLLSPARKQQAVEGLLESAQGLEQSVERVFDRDGAGAVPYRHRLYARSTLDVAESDSPDQYRYDVG